MIFPIVISETITINKQVVRCNKMVVTVVEPHENLEDTSTLGPSPADNALENHPDDD